ncbi:MAG: VacB/RNase II family 3'-5' exoribonuclease [Desulfovibrio sp.]|uniref:VacB/RNase II family 3'-5' exoribonuclease n=1 Tax=Desulfovibrio sp. TaxID=885 RepID=UPI001A68934B|nr:VacB/RNase II family 3'-5' exoribonuclease [Desulfovibrio sp.]MBD5416719.1 VacB/RNase II family 3'-5' exoribonuclease [Desulfovibrio sp.]
MKKPKKQRTDRRAGAVPAGDDLLAIFARQARPLRLDALLRAARVPRQGKRQLETELAALAREGRLVRLAGGLWTRPESLRQVTGRYRALRDGGGFVTPVREDGAAAGPELFIHPVQRGGAWHGDLVRAVAMPGREGRGHGVSRAPEGRVTHILERANKEVPVHLVRRTGATLFCRPADSRIPVNFSVSLPEDGAPGLPQGGRLEAGTLLLVTPEAELASDLWSARLAGAYGREDDVAVQEELVKLNHEAPREFPPAVLAEAANLPAGPTPEDMAGREDMRPLPLVTIDGADARDFDDAVHVEKRGKGWLLRVAIADVSHYVRPGRGQPGGPGALDAEALARGNSWYFPRSVEPMLPPALSNGLCSLKPGEDRLAMLVELPLDEKGRPGEARFAPVIMRSAARLTYDAVRDAVLDRDEAARRAIREQPRGEAVLAMLDEAFALYRVLREARRARGSLDFDLPEARYQFGPDGRVTGVGVAERHDAHRLIEEFMIAANEAVARWLGARGTPEFLYRVHPEPDAERLEALFTTLEATALESLPPRLRVNGKPDAAALREILGRAQGTPQEYVVNRLCLRALPQARYQPENVGHFGLASTDYCHFTSPIRRYADLLVHRALKAALGKPCGEIPAGQRLLRIGDQLNRRERAAMECEREMARRLACLSLAGREGEQLSGVISGVTPFGIFVELDGMPVEGMIRLEDLTDDWYVYDQDRLSLTGERLGRVWKLGDPVKVRLEEVDMGRLEIRLVPLELPAAGKAPRKGGPAAGKGRPVPGKNQRDGRRPGTGKGRKREGPAPGGRKSRSGSGASGQGKRPGTPDTPGRRGQPGRDGKPPRRERPRTSAGRPRRGDKAR